MRARDLYIAHRLAERRPITHATDTQSDYGKGYDYGRAAEWEAVCEHFTEEMGDFTRSQFLKICNGEKL
jgi:hypothetical protein